MVYGKIDKKRVDFLLNNLINKYWEMETNKKIIIKEKK
jgi:hypothetical protein